MALRHRSIEPEPGRPLSAVQRSRCQQVLLRYQGFAIGKDTVHALIDHLEAAYLLRTVPIASESIPA